MPSLGLGGAARRAYQPLLRRRNYQLLITVVDASTNIGRQTILTPTSGKKLRFVRVKVLQQASDGRHLWELFFGDAGNMITAPNRAIDVLAVPDSDSAVTRTFLKDQGPKGNRDEVLSGRWRGTAPSTRSRFCEPMSEQS